LGQYVSGQQHWSLGQQQTRHVEAQLPAHSSADAADAAPQRAAVTTAIDTIRATRGRTRRM